MINRISQNSLTFLVLSLLFLYLYIKFLLSPYLTTLETDEVVTISTFADPRTIFLKYIPNNHTLTSILGIFSNYLIGVNIIALRSISFIFLLLIFWKINKNINQRDICIFIFVIFSFDQLSIDYSFLFRGYILSAFLFVLIFFNLITLDEKVINAKLILIICSLLIFHSLSNIYLVLPVVIMITIKLFKERKLILICYFIIPVILLFLISIVITGIFLNKDFLNYKYINISNVLAILFQIIIKGFNSIFFPTTGAPTILYNMNIIHEFVMNNIFLLILFSISLFKSIYKLAKKPHLIDYVVILFFLTIILINKIPPERIFVSFYFFLILYVCYEIKIAGNKYKNIISIFGFIIIFFNFNNHNFFNENNIHLIEKKILNKIDKTNCKLEYSSDIEFEYHYFYYMYLNECNKKPNVFEFYSFYKTREN